jgi:hypothetical protein
MASPRGVRCYGMREPRAILDTHTGVWPVRAQRQGTCSSPIRGNRPRASHRLAFGQVFSDMFHRSNVPRAVRQPSPPVGAKPEISDDRVAGAWAAPDAMCMTPGHNPVATSLGTSIRGRMLQGVARRGRSLACTARPPRTSRRQLFRMSTREIAWPVGETRDLDGRAPQLARAQKTRRQRPAIRLR